MTAHVAKNVKTGRSVTIEEIGFQAQCSNDFALQVTESYTSPVSPPPYMAGAVEIELDKATGHVESAGLCGRRRLWNGCESEPGECSGGRRSGTGNRNGAL